MDNPKEYNKFQCLCLLEQQVMAEGNSKQFNFPVKEISSIKETDGFPQSLKAKFKKILIEILNFFEEENVRELYILAHL